MMMIVLCDWPNFRYTHWFSLQTSFTGFEINACPRQAEMASDQLFYGLTCPTGKLTKYSVLNVNQDYLEKQFKSAFVAIK